MYAISALVTQVLCHVALFATLLTVMWGTFLLKFGLVGTVAGRFRDVFWLFAVRCLLVLLTGALRLTSSRPGDHWTPLHVALHLLGALGSVAYWASVLRAASEMGRAKYYRPELWA